MKLEIAKYQKELADLKASISVKSRANSETRINFVTRRLAEEQDPKEQVKVIVEMANEAEQHLPSESILKGLHGNAWPVKYKVKNESFEVKQFLFPPPSII